MSAFGTVRPRSLTELCVELNIAEGIAGERLGGPTAADLANIRRLEAEIADLPADTLWPVLWRARRLVRAVHNDWHPDDREPLVRALERDLAAYM